MRPLRDKHRRCLVGSRTVLHYRSQTSGRCEYRPVFDTRCSAAVRKSWTPYSCPYVGEPPVRYYQTYYKFQRSMFSSTAASTCGKIRSTDISTRLRYIDDFFTEAVDAGLSCTWYDSVLFRLHVDLTMLPRIEDNVFNYARAGGTNMGLSLLQAIDQVRPYPSFRTMLNNLIISTGCEYSLC